MALSVRSPQAMAIRMFEVPFRPWSRMEQVAEPSNDRALRFTSLEQSSDMGVILFILVSACGEQERPTAFIAHQPLPPLPIQL